VRLQLLTWTVRTSSEPSVRPAFDWLDTERNENQSRKMTFSGMKQFASSCRDPETPGRASRFAWLLCWTHIKLVNVDKKEIELVFVVSLMKPLLVALNFSLWFSSLCLFCFLLFSVPLGSGSFPLYFQMGREEELLINQENFKVSGYLCRVMCLDPSKSVWENLVADWWVVRWGRVQLWYRSGSTSGESWFLPPWITTFPHKLSPLEWLVN
jgi:hypothetical protein